MLASKAVWCRNVVTAVFELFLLTFCEKCNGGRRDLEVKSVSPATIHERIRHNCVQNSRYTHRTRIVRFDCHLYVCRPAVHRVCAVCNTRWVSNNVSNLISVSITAMSTDVAGRRDRYGLVSQEVSPRSRPRWLFSQILRGSERHLTPTSSL